MTAKFRAWEKDLVCLHCGNDRFEEAGLNATGLKVGMSIPLATTLACSRCGLVHLFTTAPSKRKP
jgi:predicted nucleic-acid-binding Zn-ribbon protein